jgi:uncharacterized protein
MRAILGRWQVLRAALGVIVFASIAQATLAASFDCRKAGTRDEKLICATPTLSALDDELGRVYSRRLRDVPDLAELRNSQVTWLQQRQACADAACIAAAYRQRLQVLGNLSMQLFAEHEVRANCITSVWNGERRLCTVDSIKPLGNVGELAMHAVSYCLSTATRKPDMKRCENIALYVFSQKPGEKNWALQVTYDDVQHGEPAISPDGAALYSHGTATLLYIPAGLEGTAHTNVSRHYVWTNNRWEPIDTDSWIADLGKRLPPNSEFWKGIWYDLTTLTTQVGVYRKSDPNCCPSGGVANVELTLNGTRFALKSFKLEKVPGT